MPKRTSAYKEYVLDVYKQLQNKNKHPNLKDLFVRLDSPWRALTANEREMYKTRASAINAQRHTIAPVVNRSPTQSVVPPQNALSKDNQARHRYIQEQLMARSGTSEWGLMDEWDNLPDVVKNHYY